MGGGSHINIVHIECPNCVDYPDLISAVIYVQGCNLRCPYCHNPSLLEPNLHPVTGVEEKLQSYKWMIEGVVITGGEPTLYDDLPDLIKLIKNLGLKVKLDTNGTRPKMLERCLPLVDYVAMDLKSDPIGYRRLGANHELFENVKESVALIKNSKVEHEFRTTVVWPFITSESFKYILMLSHPSKVVLQKANLTNVLNPDYFMHVYSDIQLIVSEALLNPIYNISIRE